MIFLGLPPLHPLAREDAVLRSDFTSPPLRPRVVAADETGSIPSFCAIVRVALHQWPPTPSIHVGSVSPGNRSNLKAIDPSFQYAALCELMRPLRTKAFASVRFLAMICFILILLFYDVPGCAGPLFLILITVYQSV